MNLLLNNLDIIGGIILIWSYLLLGRYTYLSKFYGWLLSTIGNSLFIVWGMFLDKTPTGLMIISVFMSIIAFKHTIKEYYRIWGRK